MNMIKGNIKPKAEEKTMYQVDTFFPEFKNYFLDKDKEDTYVWTLYKNHNGKWREVAGNVKYGKSVPYTFGEKVVGIPFKIMVHKETTNFLNQKETIVFAQLVVVPKSKVAPTIGRVILINKGKSNVNKATFNEVLTAEARTTGLIGKEITFYMWEEGTAEADKYKRPRKGFVDKNGIARTTFSLIEYASANTLVGFFTGGANETKKFFVTAVYETKKATNKGAVVVADEKKEPQPEKKAEGDKEINEQTAEVEATGVDNSVTELTSDTTRSVSVIEEEKIENLLDAYFAKKEYTKQTGEEAGTLEYTFAGNGNNTGTAAQKENIAKIILGKPAVTALKDKKQYTTLEAIKAALTKDVYNKNEKISFKTFKLGADFKKVSSAPLEEKLYLVARTSMLDGKQATIIIKEKDGIIKGSAGAVLPVLEITEEQMEQKATSGEVPGTEKTQFTGTVKDNLVKIPIHLRPKSDEELKKWKDKLSKGKEDGTYTYTFAGSTSMPNGDEKRRIAGIILSNAKEGKKGNPKIEAGKTDNIEDIIDALVKDRYLGDEKITFKLYKKEPELLYLQAKAQGQKQHDKEFLNKEGAYFEIGGGKCSCNRDLTESEFKEILKYLRESERLEINNIWKPRNPGGANPSDISIASTLDKLNEVMKKYEINSCIRKVYFIAECYHETDRFYSTKEYNSSHTPRYDPYRGRGIIQLTHKEAYERYSFYRNDNSLLTNLDQVATNLDLAFDSAGWYFKQGKRLSVGDSWSPNSTDQKKYNLNTRSYPKSNYDTKFTNTDGSIVERYGSINLNLVADNDDINVISYLINGGDNGLSERKKYVAELKKVPVFICDKNNTQPSSGDWHDPVDNPISTNFYQNGNFDNTSKIWGLFGNDIRKEVSRKHTGLDFFAERGKPIYACVDGTVYNRRWHSGYGNTITIKVKDPKAFMARKRTDYTRKTSREMEKGASWSDSGDIFLFYAHLHSVNEFTFGQEVKCGQQLGTTGRSGVAGGTCAPHLHFEILCSYSMGVGTSYRINPAYFVNYKFYDEQSESERNAQTNEKNRGKINEVNGAVKLNERNLS